MARWEKWEVSEVAKWKRWDSDEVERLEVPGFIHRWASQGEPKIYSFCF